MKRDDHEPEGFLATLEPWKWPITIMFVAFVVASVIDAGMKNGCGS